MIRDQNATFFDEVLVPLAEAAREEGKQFFPVGADAAIDTYFEAPARAVMTREDFELRAADSLKNFVEELAAMWDAEGHQELANIAPHLLDLCESADEEGTDEEVSLFIYAMY